MDNLYLSRLAIAEEFTPDVIGLVYSGYRFSIDDLEKLDSLYIYNFSNSKNFDEGAYDMAVEVCEAIFKDADLKRLDSAEARIGLNEETNKLEFVWLSRNGIKRWFHQKKLDCPEILMPRTAADAYQLADKKLGAKLGELKSSQNQLIGTSTVHTLEALRAENAQLKDEVSYLTKRKWRKAFEYESAGLNALYDMIERYYIDVNGKKISIEKLAFKKTLESEWLSGRTKDEADTIITSGQRKGKTKT